MVKQTRIKKKRESRKKLTFLRRSPQKVAVLWLLLLRLRRVQNFLRNESCKGAIRKAAAGGDIPMR